MNRDSGLPLATPRREWTARQNDERDLLNRDEQFSFAQANATPSLLCISTAKGIWIQDVSGNKYRDFYGNNCHHVGYQNPQVLEHVRAQLERFCFVPRGLTSATSIELAELLVRHHPDPETKVLLVPGGSAAVELALMIAKVHTGRHKTISFWDSYHGRSIGALSVSGSMRDRSPRMGPFVPGALHAVPFYWYARKPNATKEDIQSSAQASLESLEAIFECNGDIAALIAEPIRNGPYIPPAGYWADVRKLCDRHGTLLIFDEIPMGLGKTGRLFNCEHFNVLPDMTLLGKALGGGIVPLAAVIANKKLDTAPELNLGYFTNEKNALSAAAGVGTLRVIIDGNLPARAASLGKSISARLNSFAARHEVVSNTRCSGLIFALDFAGEKGAPIAHDVFFKLLRRGILAMPPKGNALSFSAPLVIEEEELNGALDIIESTVAELAPPS